MVSGGPVAEHADVPHADAPHVQRVQHPPYVADVPNAGVPFLQLDHVDAGVDVELEVVASAAVLVPMHADSEDVAVDLPWPASVLELLYLPQSGPQSLVLLGLMCHSTGVVESEMFVPSSFPLVCDC